MEKKTTYAVVFVSMALLLVGGVSAFGLGFGAKNANLTDDQKAEMQAFHDDVQMAIENNDYATWKSLMESQLTEDAFNRMVDMHNKMIEVRDLREQMREARQNGDTETFGALQEQLQALAPSNDFGMGRGMGKGHMMGEGFGGFRGDFQDNDSE